MALFLSESVHSGAKVSLHEAMAEVMEVVTEGAELGEAILRADYILHVQSQSLQEGEMVDKAKGFLRSAYEKVKAFILKLVAKVKQFVYALVQRIKGWFGKAEIKDDQSYYVNGSAMARAKARATVLSSLAGKTFDTMDEVSGEIKQLNKDTLDAIEGKASDEKVIVKGSVIREAMKSVEGAISQLNKSEATLKKRLGNAEKAVADAEKLTGSDAKSKQEDASKALEAARANAKFVTSGLIPGANHCYSLLLAARPTWTKQKEEK